MVKEVPYDKHCEATGLLRIASVYNQGINYWPQVYLDECKYEEVENHGVLLLSDDEDDTVFLKIKYLYFFLLMF